jgi:hypothetical protein
MNMALLPLDERTLAALILMRDAPDEPLKTVISRLIEGAHRRKPSATSPAEAVIKQSQIRSRQKYVLEVLGERLEASSLGLLFASLVDLLAELDPAVLERVSKLTPRRRRYVARAKEGVHPGRPDLKTIKTKSGWWVSANVGREDVARAIRAVCIAANLQFGQDISWPGLPRR